VGLFALLYGPTRFAMDFLRNTDLADADLRYAGLTFAQWGALAMTIAGGGVLAWIRTHHAPVDPNARAASPNQD
jgi:prolipoprotein diacylglyceryltransferase